MDPDEDTASLHHGVASERLGEGLTLPQPKGQGQPGHVVEWQIVEGRLLEFEAAKARGSSFGSHLAALTRHVHRICREKHDNDNPGLSNPLAHSVSAEGVSLDLQDFWTIPPLGPLQPTEKGAEATDRLLTFLMGLARRQATKPYHWIADPGVVQYFVPRVEHTAAGLVHVEPSFTLNMLKSHLQAARDAVASGSAPSAEIFPLIDMPSTTRSISLAHNVFGHWVHIELRVDRGRSRGTIAVHDSMRLAPRSGRSTTFDIVSNELPLLARLISLRSGLGWQDVTWRREDIFEEACAQQSNASDCGYFVWLFTLQCAGGRPMDERNAIDAAALPDNRLGLRLRRKVLTEACGAVLPTAVELGGGQPSSPRTDLSMTDSVPEAGHEESSQPHHLPPVRGRKGRARHKASKRGRTSVAIGSILTTGQNNVNQSRWSGAEIRSLVRGRQLGMPWADIFRENPSLQARGKRACRSRYNRILRHHQRLQQDGLANDYMGDLIGGVEVPEDSTSTTGSEDHEAAGQEPAGPDAAETDVAGREDSENEAEADVAPMAVHNAQLTGNQARMFCEITAKFRSVAGAPAHLLFGRHSIQAPDFSDLSATLSDYRDCVDFQREHSPGAKLMQLDVLFAQSVNDHCSRDGKGFGKICYSRTGSRKKNYPLFYIAAPWAEQERHEYRSQTPFERMKLNGPVLDWHWEDYDLPVLPIIVAMAERDGSNARFRVGLQLERDVFTAACHYGRRFPVVLISFPDHVISTPIDEVLDCMDRHLSGMSHPTGGSCQVDSSRTWVTVNWTFDLNSDDYKAWSTSRRIATGAMLQDSLLERLNTLYSLYSQQTNALNELLPTWGEAKRLAIPQDGVQDV